MRVTVDTNVLVRALTGDDPHQSAVAKAELLKADTVAVPLTALCELAWVLGQGYKIAAHDISTAIRRIVNAASVSVDRPSVEAGLTMLESGGDFADGVIAYEGQWLGGRELISLDRQTVRLLAGKGVSARLIG